jgi:hypothetical protein
MDSYEGIQGGKEIWDMWKEGIAWIGLDWIGLDWHRIA